MAQVDPAGIVERLRESLGARAVVADDPGYDDARAVWNGMIDARPAVVVRAVTTSEMQDVVRAAGERPAPRRAQTGATTWRGSARSTRGSCSTCRGCATWRSTRASGSRSSAGARRSSAFVHPVTPCAYAQ